MRRACGPAAHARIIGSVKPALALAVLTLLAAAAQADPGYYVVRPYSDKGVSTVELRYWTVKPRDGVERVWPEFGFAHGVTSRWTTGVFASGVGRQGQAVRLGSWNWTNDLMLTQGEWPIDIALHTQLIRNRGEGSAIEFGPVLRTDIGRTEIGFNVFWDRAFNTHEPRPTELKLQWQLRHRAWPGLQVGVQGFSELGPWDDWSPRREQSHRAGPALFGQWRGDGARMLDWHAAWLVGDTYGRRGHMFTSRIALNF